jgi:CheY-like chemotaxis protein
MSVEIGSLPLRTGANAGGTRLLLIERDPAFGDLLGSALTACGYVVREASTAREACDLLAQGDAFDLVLSDAQLPGAWLLNFMFPSMPELDTMPAPIDP